MYQSFRLTMEASAPENTNLPLSAPTGPESAASGAVGVSGAAVVGPRDAPAAVLVPRSRRRALLALPAQEAWVGRVRHFACTMLDRWGLCGDDRDSAVLIVGELAANAACHGHSDMTLCLGLDANGLDIAVADSGDACRARPPRADDDPDEHGRGLGIVDALASRVEILHDDRGRRVHARLSVAAVPQPRASGPRAGSAAAEPAKPLRIAAQREAEAVRAPADSRGRQRHRT